MALAKFLDAAIRKSEEGKVASRYKIVSTGKTYDNYLRNDAWEAFLDKMSDTHKAQFEKGRGSELKEGEKTPPKMASFGSSSRFVYNLLERVYGEEFEKVEFEKKLPTRVSPGVPNLDAYIQGDCEVFIEAKCREIYIDDNAYQKVYDHIGIELLPNFRWKGNYIRHFDIKQLICHFLGISAYILESGEKHNIKFVYLIYNPSDVVKEDNEEGTKILKQYGETLYEIYRFDMEKLFADIFEFQKNTNRTVRKKSGNYNHFEFVVADQNTIEQHLK